MPVEVIFPRGSGKDLRGLDPAQVGSVKMPVEAHDGFRADLAGDEVLETVIEVQTYLLGKNARLQLLPCTFMISHKV